MAPMLGRLRRTTRTDVGLALAFAGIAYLIWALVAGISRELVQEMIRFTAIQGGQLKAWVRIIFVEGGVFIDLIGLAWMAVSLVMVLLSSRQRVSISWAWLSAISEMLVAALGSMLVAWAAYKSHVLEPGREAPTVMAKISGISLPVIIVIAVLVWTTFLIWLLVERARLDRRGPTLRDGLRTNIYR